MFCKSKKMLKLVFGVVFLISSLANASPSYPIQTASVQVAVTLPQGQKITTDNYGTLFSLKAPNNKVYLASAAVQNGSQIIVYFDGCLDAKGAVIVYAPLGGKYRYFAPLVNVTSSPDHKIFATAGMNDVLAKGHVAGNWIKERVPPPPKLPRMDI